MKPTSRCIDIRQEHPLLEKFKEWYCSIDDYEYVFCGIFYGMDKGDLCIFDYKEKIPKIITLEEWRERRGKEYYEGVIVDEGSIVNIELLDKLRPEI